MGIFYGKCRSTARLDGKTAIVTGSNTGIGQYTAYDLYKRGCRVIMACRNAEKAESAKQAIQRKCTGLTGLGELLLESLDLSSMSSVRSFANKMLDSEEKIDLLINNAGVMMCPKTITEDGFELQFGTNHLGHFLLTMLLLPRILSSAPARIINVSSVAHLLARRLDWDDLCAEKSYGPVPNYCKSKLANVLFTCELARRLEGRGVNVYSLHPGVVNTELARHADTLIFPGAAWLYKHVGGFFQKSVEQGSQTTIYCAVDEEVGKETGFYYDNCKQASMSSLAKDPELAKKLWDISLKMVQLPGYDPFNGEELTVEDITR